VDLTWNAPEGCPSRDAVLAEVSRNLTGVRPRAAVAHAHVTRLAPQRWSVHLVTDVDDTPGERSFEADSCAALAGATALIVAWTMDPRRALGSAPEPAALRATPPVEPSPMDTADAYSPPASTNTGLSGVVAMTAQSDVGTLPNAAWAAEITAGAILGRLRVEASGSMWSDQDATRNAVEGAHLHLMDGALRGCWRATVGRSLEIDPCVGAGLAHLSSEGFGETAPYRRDAWWSMVQGGLLGTWAIVGPVALRALVGVAVPLARPAIVIQDSTGGTIPLHQPSAAALQAALGVELHFP
jgi:hypothetical protein